MSRLLLAPALALACLLGAWATAPIAGQIAVLLFGGLADGLRGALWAVGVGLGAGVAISLPILAVGRVLTGGARYTALPRPVARWEGPALPSGDIEGEYHEVGEEN